MDSEGNADEYWTFEEIAFSCRQSGLQALPESDIGEQNCAVNDDSPQKSVRKEETRQTADMQQNGLTAAENERKLQFNSKEANITPCNVLEKLSSQELPSASEFMKTQQSTFRKSQIKCSQCDQSAANKKEMARHGKLMHGIAYEFVCDSCGLDFPTNFKLKDHKVRHHDKKSMKCGLCNFETANKASRKRHLKNVHEGVDVDIKCTECIFEAKEHEELENHLLDTHYDITNISLSTCSECGFSTYHEPTFKAHVKSMHGTKCELCTFSATSRKRLQMHIESWHMRPRAKL